MYVTVRAGQTDTSPRPPQLLPATGHAHDQRRGVEHASPPGSASPSPSGSGTEAADELGGVCFLFPPPAHELTKLNTRGM